MSTSLSHAAEKTLANGDQVNYDGTFYDYRAADGTSMIKVWVPPHAQPVRGILISGHGGGTGDSRDFARDKNMQAFAARFGFGLAGLHYFPGRSIYDNNAPAYGARGGPATAQAATAAPAHPPAHVGDRRPKGQVFFDALNEFAKLGPHPELANVPFCIFGSSNGGSTAYGFANYAPERCICFVSNVATGGNPPIPVDGALKVPGIFVLGRYDPFMREMQGVERVHELLAGARARGARWSMIVEDKGHEDGVAFDVYAKLVEQSIRLRYPDTLDPRKGPVVLKDIPEDAGWLADMSTWESGLTRIAAYGDYKGDKKTAAWLLDKDIAYVYRGAATRFDPIGVGIQEVGRVYNPNTAPGTMFSVGGPLVEPGRKLTLVCDVRDLPNWQSITFYNGSKKLGTVEAGHDPTLPVTVDSADVVWCLTAEAVTKDGQTRVSPPFYFAIEDPQADLLSDAQKNPPVYQPLAGPIGSKTMASIPAGYIPKAGGNAQNILVAYGLTADQEKTFGADPHAVSAFWNEMGDNHDHIYMDQKNNAREGSQFSAVHTQDARMLARAAHSARGLYLYFQVTDNMFMNYDPNPDGYINTDAIDVLLDSKSASYINDPAHSTQYINQGWGLFLSTTQYQVAFGGDAPPPVFKLNRAQPWDMFFHMVQVSDAQKRLGIQIRWVKLDKMHRVQEWFIPWTAIGRPGDLPAEPAVGTRLGFSLGYTDLDHGGEDPGLPKQLRWIDHTTPWAFSATRGAAPKGWGDIEIGPELKVTR